jgi:hypothetical protein
MKKAWRWVKCQPTDRPFMSVLVILLIVMVPGYARLEATVNQSNENADNFETVVKTEAQRLQEQNIINCQIRNTANANTRTRFNALFGAIEVAFIGNPNTTEQEKQQAKKFVDDLRAAVPLDPTTEDVDCNDDNILTNQDYSP